MSGPFKMKGWSPFTQKTHPKHPVIPPTEEPAEYVTDQTIPAWVKNNAGWWADGIIDDSTFVSGIEYLVKSGIIVVS